MTRGQSFLWGVGGALALILIAILVFCAYVVWMRARNGQAAYECLQSATCRAQFAK